MSQDRKQLIRLAASRPVGDPVRRVLLGELQKQSWDFHPREMREALEDKHIGRKPNSKEVNAWKKRGKPNACPVCGSTNSTPPDYYREGSVEYGCENCGSSWELSFTVKIDKLEGVQLNPQVGDFRQQPLKGTMLDDIAGSKRSSDSYRFD